MNNVDLHCDTLLRLYLHHKTLESWDGHINLEKLKAGGALLQCLAIYTPMYDSAEHYGIKESPWQLFNSMQKIFEQQTETYSDRIRAVKTMQDIRLCESEGLISAMLTLEDGACIDGRIERVEELYSKGVRMIALTWNHENCIGYPNSFEADKHAKGLKNFGFEVLSEMNRLGMVIDVSHLSEGGFFDVARVSKKPFIASHSCARALCDHSRCLTDEQLRTLGDCGGVCGVNFFSEFLVKDSKHTENADILRHMEYIANKAGMESVALGSDFDGIDCTLEMEDYSGMTMLTEQIAKRFGSDNADRICCGNALRVFGEVMA